MKAYGLRNKFIYNYKDYHPQKGFINWWEAELNTVKSKKTERQKGKKHIINELRTIHKAKTL